MRETQRPDLNDGMEKTYQPANKLKLRSRRIKRYKPWNWLKNASKHAREVTSFFRSVGNRRLSIVLFCQIQVSFLLENVLSGSKQSSPYKAGLCFYCRPKTARQRAEAEKCPCNSSKRHCVFQNICLTKENAKLTVPMRVEKNLYKRWKLLMIGFRITKKEVKAQLKTHTRIRLSSYFNHGVL